MIKKILMAVAALAMPIGTVAAVGVVGSGVAGAAAPPPTTITCPVTGTFAFAPPGSSAGGALTANTSVKGSVSETPTGTGCSGKASILSVPSATTLCPETGGVPNAGDPAACLASKTKGDVTTYSIATKPYYYDIANDYATTGLSDLQAAWVAKPPKTTIDNIPVTLAFGSVAPVTGGGACGATTVGFEVTGNAQDYKLTVGTYDDVVCLSGDHGTGTTGNFLADLYSPTAVVTSGTVGGSSSLTVVFPSESCPVTGTVTFAPPGLSQGGALTANSTSKSSATTTATGTGCSGLPSTTGITSATTPCPQTGGVPNAGDPAACLASKTKGDVTTYSIALKPNYYDTTSGFGSALADLQAALVAKPPKGTVDNLPLTFNFGSASQVIGAPCTGSDVGFSITGPAELKGLTVGTYAELVCLSSDHGTGTTGSFLADLGSSTAIITSATIGDDSSLTVSF